MVVYGFKQRNLNAIARIIDAKGSVSETTWPIARNMHEWGHGPGCSLSCNTPVFRYEAQQPDTFRNARIGFRLCGEDRIPVGGVSDVFKQIDGWKARPHNAVRPGPFYADDLRINQDQPPRILSR